VLEEGGDELAVPAGLLELPPAAGDDLRDLVGGEAGGVAMSKALLDTSDRALVRGARGVHRPASSGEQSVNSECTPGALACSANARDIAAVASVRHRRVATVP
jgi:hypothetical protein